MVRLTTSNRSTFIRCCIVPADSKLAVIIGELLRHVKYRSHCATTQTAAGDKVTAVQGNQVTKGVTRMRAVPCLRHQSTLCRTREVSIAPVVSLCERRTVWQRLFSQRTDLRLSFSLT